MKKSKILCGLIFVIFLFLGCSNSSNSKRRLPPPTIRTCKATSSTTVFLSWTAVPDADWYAVIYYDFTENGGKGLIGKSPVYGTSCTVSDLDPNTDYGFRVKALSDNPDIRTSFESEIVGLTTPSD